MAKFLLTKRFGGTTPLSNAVQDFKSSNEKLIRRGGVIPI